MGVHTITVLKTVILLITLFRARRLIPTLPYIMVLLGAVGGVYWWYEMRERRVHRDWSRLRWELA